MAFNLKGLLQDEEFLLGAGLLSAGSQGQNLGSALMPSLVQAGKIKKAFAPTVNKTKQAYDNVLGKNVFVTDAEIAGMPTRFTPIDNSQATSFNAETGDFYSGSVSGMKLKEKNQINDKRTASILKGDYNILQSNINELQEKVIKTPTGAYGKVVSGFNIVADQFAQIKDFSVDNKFAKNSVLNKYNQVHAVPNVYVTDGACMTSSGCQNPSLTYMALTARAANHAAKEFNKNKNK